MPPAPEQTYSAEQFRRAALEAATCAQTLPQQGTFSELVREWAAMLGYAATLHSQRAALLEALKAAKETIRTWHGMGMRHGEAEAWALYQQSPEMKRLNAAIAHAEAP